MIAVSDFEDRVRALPRRHIDALRWFKDRAGSTVRWDELSAGPIRLVCAPKGIYKPAWSDYALSIRQTLSSEYPDQAPVVDDDGRWTYRYYQETLDPANRDLEYTNRALMKNHAEDVPVGVLLQRIAKPKAVYEVLGLGVLERWTDGYFPVRELR